jgi:hypothetical protein
MSALSTCKSLGPQCPKGRASFFSVIDLLAVFVEGWGGPRQQTRGMQPLLSPLKMIEQKSQKHRNLPPDSLMLEAQLEQYAIRIPRQ